MHTDRLKRSVEIVAQAAEPRRKAPARPLSALGLRLWAGGVALLLVLAPGAWLAYRATQDLALQNALVQRSFDAGARLTQVLVDLEEAEGNQRGYLITGSVAQLVLYDAALGRLVRDVDAVDRLIGDDPDQAGGVRELRLAAHQGRVSLDRGVAARQDEVGWFLLGRAGQDAQLAADKDALDRVRQTLAGLQATETQRLGDRRAAAADAAHGARLAAVLPSLAAVLLACAVFVLLGRAEHERRRADAAWNRERERLLAEERVARREAEAASRAKDEFLSTVSHELRTPLQGVMGWLEVLKRPQSSDEQRGQAIERIEHNAHSQARIVEDLLDAARMLTGKLKLRLTQADAAAVVRDAADICRAAAQAKGIDFRLDVTEPELRLVCDRDRLQQIVVNLLSNAIKFTPRGGQIALRLRREQSQAEIEVQDSGIGIAPQLLERIFERYVQASTSSARRYGGVGLGLSIVKNLAELHGGTVSAASGGEGRGATFTVRLPISATLPQPATPPEAAADTRPAGAGPIAGLRILVVDDEADTRDLLTVLLGAEGAAVDAVASARQALERLRHSTYDALVSDIGMPDEDGYSLLRRVREADSSRTVPAIALTAFAGVRDRRRALEAGFDTQLAKPVEISELVAALAWVTGRAGAPR